MYHRPSVLIENTFRGASVTLASSHGSFKFIETERIYHKMYHQFCADALLPFRTYKKYNLRAGVTLPQSEIEF